MGEPMTKLKSLCLFLGLAYLAVALSGINAVSGTRSGMTVSHLNAFGRIWAVAVALILATFAYGLHRRMPIVWKAGFILLALGYIDAAVQAVTATYRAADAVSFSSFWLPSALVVLVGGAVTIYWGLWWKRQRSYFL
jgi:hypothetical protein